MDEGNKECVRDMSKRQELANQLLNTRLNVITSSHLEQSIVEKYRGTLPEGTSGSPEIPLNKVCEFLDVSQKDLIEAINMPLLEELYLGINADILRIPYVQMDSGHVKSEDFNTVAKFVSDLHTNLQTLYIQKEEIIHHMHFFTSAIQFLESFQVAAEGLVKRRFPTQKKPKVDFPGFCAIIEDVGIYVTRIKGWTQEFNEFIEKVSNSRINHLLRLESSVRLLEKYRDRDGGWEVKS